MLFLCAAAACGGAPAPQELASDDDAGPSFIALDSDFQGFNGWTAFDGGPLASDGLDGGPRTIFINQLPPKGSRVFPLGTILVKTTAGAATFAMVKRGGGFNPDLPGWEWFQLAEGTDGGPQILWRGTGPSSTLSYGDIPAVGCNGCHFNAAATDFVYGAPASAVSF